MLSATLLALASAALHATWNLLVKTSDERFLTAWAQFVCGALLFLPVLLFIETPGTDALPFLVASSVVHVLYVFALVWAYEHGDFSVAYPIARGGGAVVAAFGGVLFLDDHLATPAWVAITIVACGLASLARPHVARLALIAATFTAITIGVYTTLDAAGARRSTGFGYGISLITGAALALTITGTVWGRAPALVRSLRGGWPKYLAGGACLTVAYSLVLAAVRLAPVGYVASLRESSVVLAALAGWLLLKEPLGKPRLFSSLVIAAGLVLLVVVR